MLVLKIYDCKLRKNTKKNAKQWRVNQNTTITYWYNKYPYNISIKKAFDIANNLNYYYPHIKNQKNTRVEFYFTNNNISD